MSNIRIDVKNIYLYSGCEVTSFLNHAAVVSNSPEARFCISFIYACMVQ